MPSSVEFRTWSDDYQILQPSPQISFNSYYSITRALKRIHQQISIEEELYLFIKFEFIPTGFFC